MVLLIKIWHHIFIFNPRRMKRINFGILFLSVTTLGFSQSKSYQALHNHFAGKEDVHSFSLSGFLCRAALTFVSHDDQVRSMAKDIHHVRFMVIPREEFGKQDLSVNGFKAFLAKDSFEPLASIRDHGDHVSVFHRSEGNQKDRYFVLVEEPGEVVAIEMKGYIDPSIFNNKEHRITSNQR